MSAIKFKKRDGRIEFYFGDGDTWRFLFRCHPTWLPLLIDALKRAHEEQ
jgi:hypothetical protein